MSIQADPVGPCVQALQYRLLMHVPFFLFCIQGDHLDPCVQVLDVCSGEGWAQGAAHQQ